MALYLIATPIGNYQDITLRGLQLLKTVPIIILEEFKECTAFLRSHGITAKQYEQLNEHSTSEDLFRLLDLCRNQEVALITDCGTPGFADPGADLVKLCRQNKIKIHTIPGPSSLMSLLSLSGAQENNKKLDQFLFRGFLSAETELRQKQWLELKKESRPIVIMDTPYRLQKTLQEVQQYFPDKNILLGMNLTSPEECVLEGKPADVIKQTSFKKAEFMLLIYI